jgi:hypothetical protein
LANRQYPIPFSSAPGSGGGGGSGTVTSVGLTVNGTSPSGIFTVTGSPVSTSGTLNVNLAGTSGGVPYFSSGTVVSSSAQLASTGVVIGGGAATAPSTSTQLLFSAPTLTVGLSGTSTGAVAVTGATSGTATITAQATAGTPTLTLPNASGTFVVSASAPLAVSSTTGNATITGVAGAVLAGSGPAFTISPTLGVAGASTGTLSMTGATSGTVLITPQATAGSPTLTLPNATGTFAISASSPIVLSSTTGALTGPTIVTSAASLTANQLVIGSGSQGSQTLGSLGTTTTLLHGNAGGAPTFSAVDLTADVTGVLPAANGGAGQAVTANQGYYILPTGSNTMTAAATTSTFTANHVRAMLFVLPYTVTFTKMVLNVTTTSNGNNYFAAVYSADKSTLLRQGTFTLGAGTGALSATVSSTTLRPGPYWFAWAADNTAAVVTAWGNVIGTNTNPFNLNNVKLGDSDQLVSGGVMPATLGTITASGLNPAVVMIEP